MGIFAGLPSRTQVQTAGQHLRGEGQFSAGHGKQNCIYSYIQGKLGLSRVVVPNLPNLMTPYYGSSCCGAPPA